jgi:hypothetical protein
LTTSLMAHKLVSTYSMTITTWGFPNRDWDPIRG